MAMVEPFGRKWWSFVVRGVVAVLFGILCFARPGMSLGILLAFYGAYALVDGIFALVATERAARTGRGWGALTFYGIAGIAAGVVTWFYPGLTALALLFVIGAWAIIAGAFEIGFALRLRETIRHHWLLALAGALSIAFGIVLFLRPGPGALAVLWLIGTYAVLVGLLQIAFGLRAREMGAGLRGMGLPVDQDRGLRV